MFAACCQMSAALLMLSGVATVTRESIEMVESLSLSCQLVDTNDKMQNMCGFKVLSTF